MQMQNYFDDDDSDDEDRKEEPCETEDIPRSIACLTEQNLVIPGSMQFANFIQVPEQENVSEWIESCFDMPQYDIFVASMNDPEYRMNQEELMKLMDELTNKWISLPLFTHMDIFIAYRIFGLQYTTVTVVPFDDVDAKRTEIATEFTSVWKHLTKSEFYISDSATVEDFFSRIFNMYIAIYKLVYQHIHTRIYVDKQVPQILNYGQMALRGKTINALANSLSTEENDDIVTFSPFEKVYLFLLEEIKIRGFRKKGKSICEEIRTPPNDQGISYRTRNFKEKYTIEEFVYQSISKETHFEIWRDKLQGNNLAKAIQNLESISEVEFPELKMDRLAWSYKNGIHLASVGKFIKYEDSDQIPVNLVTSKYFNVDMPEESCNYQVPDEYVNPEENKYDRNEIPPLPYHYYDGHYDENGYHGNGEYLGPQLNENGEEVRTWRDLQTPHFDHFVATQQLGDPIVIEIFIFCFGRNLYELGIREVFQFITFIVGKGNTGKSLLARILYYLYEDGDVGTQAPNMEEQWGVGSFADAFFFICTEVKKRMKMNEGEFLQITAGENVALAKKFSDPRRMKWNSHGVWMGNDVPDWIDVGGNIARRFLIFRFLIVPLITDPHLFEKIIGDIGTLIVKSNACYLEYSARYGHLGLWNWVPLYFKDTQRFMLSNSHPLESFLEYCDAIEVTKDAHHYMKRQIFMIEFAKYMRNNLQGQKPAEMNDDAIESVFNRRGLTIEEGAKEYDGRLCATKWICGIRLVENEDI
jgi:hypothetical protein